MQKIAIIGTGISALSIAYHLPKLIPHTQITFFQKSRRPGGRLSTRTSRSNSSYQFNHGAPYLKKQDISNELKDILLNKTKCIHEQKFNVLEKQNSIYSIKQSQIYRGTSSAIQSIPISLHSLIPNKTFYNTRISEIQKIKTNLKQNIFRLKTAQGIIVEQNFDYVFCCIPYPQIKLLKIESILMRQNLQTIEKQYWPTWSIMIANQGKLLDDLLLKNNILSKTINVGFKLNENIFKFVKQQPKNNQDKNDEQWVFYMSKEWSQTNKDLKPQQVQNYFIKQLNQVLKTKIQIKFLKAHRWLYSFPKQVKQKSQILICSKDKRVIFTGDWAVQAKNIGECWQLGRQVIQKLIEQKQTETKISQSKL